MVNKYDVAAAHVINAYFWEKLKEEIGNHWKLVNGKVPIIPAQQQPEMTESGSNYMTYIYMDENTRDLHALRYQQLEWIIYSPKPAAITATIALAIDLFGQLDWSAQALNKWMDEFDFPLEYDPFFKRFRFKQIALQGATSSQPATDEGGTRDGFVSISYSFVELD